MSGERSHFSAKAVEIGDGRYAVAVRLTVDPLPGQETFAQSQTWQLAPGSARFLLDQLQEALDRIPDDR